MADIKTYSPDRVIMTFGGTKVEGWNTITITRQSPAFKQIAGIRGENSRVRVQNTAAKISIEVPQTSDLNTIFTQIVALDEQLGSARIEVLIRDILNGDTFSSTNAYLENYADLTFDIKKSNRTWVMNCLDSQYEQGMSGGLSGLINQVTSMF